MTLSAFINNKSVFWVTYIYINYFGRHLGRSLVSKNLSYDEMLHIIYFHNLLTIKEQFGIIRVLYVPISCK